MNSKFRAVYPLLSEALIILDLIAVRGNICVSLQMPTSPHPDHEVTP